MRCGNILPFCVLVLITFLFIAGCSQPGTDKTLSPMPTPTVSSIESISSQTTPSQIIRPASPVVTGTERPVTELLKRDSPDPDGPVSLTINSARKQLGLGEWGMVYSEPIAGNVYLVLDITVKNNNAPEGFVFTNSSLVVQDLDTGTFTKRPFRLHQSLRKYVENPFTLPATVEQGDAITGQILFEMNDSVNYRVDLLDNKNTVIASRLVSFDNLLTDDAPVSITIHSARKVREFNSSMPHPVLPNQGHIYLILNVSIKNNNIREGYGFDFTSTHIQDLRNGNYGRQSINNGVNIIKNLKNPITVPTTIKQNGTKTGELLFSIADSTEYRLNLIDNNKTIIASRTFNAEY
jgi:hypothetical protein